MRRLDNPVRRYAWGSVDAIPRLLGTEHDGEPQAELWMGAHERASSRVTDGSLWDVIAADPVGSLGPRWANGGRLPFLAKIVAVAAPLSLQVHPRAALAREWHAAEAAAGVGPDSDLRCCPDAVEKVEMVYAVSDFELLCGFRPLEELLAWLQRVDLAALRPTATALRSGGQAALPSECERLMTRVDPVEVTSDLLDREQILAGDPVWAASARPLLDLARRYPDDPAVCLALLLQPLRLAPAEVVLISPGQPHTYLAGTAFEVQTNSDNVIRAGLTGKHVDVPLLLRALDTTARGLARVPAHHVGAETVFTADTDGFTLSVVEEGEGRLRTVCGPQVFCCLDGVFELDDADGTITLRQGQSAFAPADAGDVTVSGRGTLVRVAPGRAG